MTQEEIKIHNIKWYQRTYNQLIEKGRQLEKEGYNGVYTEVHHIIPKCMGGTNDKNNLVRLTARYHVVAHMLLACIYPENRSILFAVNIMFNSKNFIRDFKQSSRLIARFREGFKKSLRDTGILRKDGTVGFKAKTAVCYDENLNVIKIYFPINLVKEDGFSPSSVAKHCRSNNTLPYGGYYWKFLEDFENLYPENLKEYNPDNMEIDLTFKNLSYKEKLKARHYPERNDEWRIKISLANKGKKKKESTTNFYNKRRSKQVVGPDGIIYDTVKQAANKFGLTEKTLRKYIINHPEKGFKYLSKDQIIIDNKNNIFETLKLAAKYYNVSKQTIINWIKSGRNGLKYIDKN